MTADLFVKGARVVKPDAIVDCGLAIRARAIAAVLAPGETVDARRTLDAGGRYVLPGCDVHPGSSPDPGDRRCRLSP